MTDIDKHYSVLGADYTVRVGSSFSCDDQTFMCVTDNDKHYSLLESDPIVRVGSSFASKIADEAGNDSLDYYDGTPL